ncbi:MAG: hypothetical protein GY710_11105 [Desulfobacteraceae bacterium]|nr:hypothetical protein [Desulfobacteraceae bacterium]
MKKIGTMASSVEEISNTLDAIIRENNKYNTRHIRFKNDIFYFHTGIGRIGYGGDDRKAKRKAGTDNIRNFFYNWLRTIRTDQMFEKRFLWKMNHIEWIKGRDLKTLCNYFHSFSQQPPKSYKQYEPILQQAYQLYKNNDVIILGGSHGEEDCRGLSFLKTFFEFLKWKRVADISTGHIIFYEIFLSLQSHYERRKISNYDLKENYQFKYHPHYENPNELQKFFKDLSLKHYSIATWFIRQNIKMMFYDDMLTGGTIKPPDHKAVRNSRKSPNFTINQFKRDLRTVGNMHNLKQLPNFPSINGPAYIGRINTSLRLKANDLIARRIANDICRNKKSFIPIGTAHTYTDMYCDQSPSLQHYLRRYLGKYSKKIAVIKFENKDNPHFQSTRHTGGMYKGIDAIMSWPSWVDNLKN